MTTPYPHVDPELIGYAQHEYSQVDDTRRCIHCEVGVWNGRGPCPGRPITNIEWVTCWRCNGDPHLSCTCFAGLLPRAVSP